MADQIETNTNNTNNDEAMQELKEDLSEAKRIVATLAVENAMREYEMDRQRCASTAMKSWLYIQLAVTGMLILLL